MKLLVIGSGIACHFANAGFQVIMLDLPGSDENQRRNQVAEDALAFAVKQKPAPLYHSGHRSHGQSARSAIDYSSIDACPQMSTKRSRLGHSGLAGL